MLADLEHAASRDEAGADDEAALNAEQVAEVARFGMADHAKSGGPRKPRRARKPSKPLPLL
jgi:ATP-dependent Lhr-like helicase